MGAPEQQQIVLVAPNLGDGGSQRVVTLLAEAWSRQGHSVCVVTLYDRPDFYRLPSDVRRVSLGGDGLHLFRVVITFFQRLGYLLGRLWPDAGPAWVRSLRRLLTTGAVSVLSACGRAVRRLLGRRGLEMLVRVAPSTRRRLRGLRQTVLDLKPSVVISFTGPTNVMSVLACRDLSARLVISERNDPTRQSLRFPWNDLRPHAYREADVVTANSRGAIERLREWVPADRLCFVPNPLVVRSEGGSSPRNGDAPRMLIVGRLHTQKGHDVLLNALTLLPPDVGEWTLVVVG
ncbi:MAG: glycosyltransferase, partial [Candidatus Binatia bacterium]